MAVNLTQDDVSGASMKYSAITLEWDVYCRWRSVGRAEGLTKNNEIASFLLQRYQKSIDGVQVAVTCIHCHRPLKVKVQNPVKSKHSDTVCGHGQNASQPKSTLSHDTETVASGQKVKGCADSLLGGKLAEGGQLQHTETGKQHVAGSNSKKVTEVKLEITSFETVASAQKGREFGKSAGDGQLQHTATEKQSIADNSKVTEIKAEPEIANQPTGFCDQRDTSGVSGKSEDGKSEAETVSIKSDPHCMTSEQSQKFEGQGLSRLCETKTNFHAPLVHNAHVKQDSKASTVTSSSKWFKGGHFKSLLRVTGSDQMHGLGQNASQTLLASAEGSQSVAPCWKCQKMFEKKSLPAHEKKCVKPFSCSHCSSSFQTDDQLQRHMQRHTGQQQFYCKACKASFNERRYLKVHMQIVHSRKASHHTCGICQASFKTIELLRRHKKTHTKTHVCEVCKAAFANSFQLKCHMRRHSGERPFACDQCPAKFHTWHILKMHLRRHLGIKPFACEDCGKTFQCRYTLKVHKQVHTNERPFICEVCGKTFKGKSVLNKHRQTHKADKNLKKGPPREAKFEQPRMCEVCGVTFICKSSYYAHKKRHDDPKKYECSMCNAVLSSSYSYKGHMMRHTGEQPYRCTICNAAYVVKSRLEMHMKRHHRAASAVSDDSSQKAKDAADLKQKNDSGEQC